MPFVGWIPTETDTAINLFDKMEAIFRGGKGWPKRNWKRGGPRPPVVGRF
jgi:hypothetical protein